MDAVRYGPTDGLSYNPNDENYWDADALQKEITRAFELCHGCRLCFKYCSSFPALFAAVDANDGDVRQTAQETVDRVVDHCFQCQLCYVNCPYTPGEEHEFQLDFPRLLMRIKAQRVKKTGLAWREKMFRDPVKIGERAKPTASIANWANTVRPLRVIAEKTLGIHRDKQLPQFHGETFADWFRKDAPQGSGENGAVVLFNSCFVNYNGPDIGRDVVEVLARNHLRIQLGGVACCGMPALDAADIDFAKAQARKNVEALYPLVEQGLPIAVVNPTCSLMLRREYPELLAIPGEDELTRKAVAVAESTYDIAEFVFQAAPGEEARRGLSIDARTHRVPGALPPEDAEHRLPLARSHAAHPRGEGEARERVHRSRRHLRDEGRALRRVDQGGPTSIRRHAEGGRGDMGDRLPHGRNTTRAARWEEGVPPVPDPRSRVS